MTRRKIDAIGKKNIVKCFWEQVRITSDCWLWEGRPDKDGYGCFHITRNKVERAYRAHRFAYMLVFGTVTSSIDLHHECKTRLCVNPYHLTPLDHSTHRQLETERAEPLVYCRRGHKFTPETTLIEQRNGRAIRRCKTCRHAWREAQYALRHDATDGHWS